MRFSIIMLLVAATRRIVTQSWAIYWKVACMSATL